MGETADLAKCTTKFQDKVAKLNQKASAAAIACRYDDNGDGTVTDYDTGLQWEQKDGTGGGSDAANPHDVDNTYSWATFIKTDGTGFLDQLNGESSDGTSVTGCFAGRCDWRLPTVSELQTILLAPYPCGTSPCIDPIFGVTASNNYWSSTTYAGHPTNAWVVKFNDAFVFTGVFKGIPLSVRAVRGAL